MGRLFVLWASALCARLGGCQAQPHAPAAAGPRGEVTLPPTSGRFDYQLGGAAVPGADVTVVERDRTEDPARGAYSICYLNAFQTQPEEARWWQEAHPGLLLRIDGDPVEDPEWPGELLLDTSTPATRAGIAEVVGGWIDSCAERGYLAVELDNLDAWTRSGRARPGRLRLGDRRAVPGRGRVRRLHRCLRRPRRRGGVRRGRPGRLRPGLPAAR